MFKKIILLLIVNCSSILFGSVLAVNVIPLPNAYDLHKGYFEFNAKTKWIVENLEQLRVAKQLIDCFQSSASFKYSIQQNGSVKSKNTVLFKSNKSLPHEGYKLTVTNQQVLIEASGTNGFFYAIQSIKQLLPATISDSRTSHVGKWTIPAVTINDSPRFGYRGFMLDVSRYFMPKADVLKLIDLLSFHKINYFHWHLVDDNGWRIEIKKYPKLTNISAWRVDRNSYFSMRTNPEEGESTPVGGYYTQEDIKEIVKYAQDRCIEIIPEIEMPAHTISSLAAYPELACPVVDHFIGVLPGIGGQHASDIYCAGNDSVFVFLQDVLSEVIELFPSKYIHIGGDEADKTNWEKCPKCQARMKEHNIPNEEELQSYFIKRINSFLKNNNKKLMGWDELVDSEIPEDATIFGWRGMGLAAEKAGEKGFNYIKSPAQKYYFIRYQGPQWFEPFTYFGNTTLKDVYEYEPMNMQLPISVTNKMLGVEACLWTEFVNNTKEAEYLIFPRLAAFAESAWTKPENKSWNSFVPRVDKIAENYRYLDVNYAHSMYNVAHIVKSKEGKLNVQFNSIRPDASIHYTIDGSEPTVNDLRYTDSFYVKPPLAIKASVFINKVRKGEILPLNIMSHKAVGANVTAKDPIAYVLTNGIRGSEKKSDGEWISYYNSDAEFVIELDSAVNASGIEIGMLNNSGMSIHLPSSIVVQVSVDNQVFKPVVDVNFTDEERFQNGLFRTTKKYEFNSSAFKYIKITARKPGNSPANHVRGAQATHMAFDEIILK